MILVPVDVRDMLCAQAIALAGQAAKQAPAGAVLDVVCNTDDVKTDLLIWAREMAYPVLGSSVEPEGARVRIHKDH